MSDSRKRSLQEATTQFHDGDLINANLSLAACYQQKEQNPRDATLSIAVVADQALCRFRAATHLEAKRCIHYRDAIIQNERYVVHLQRLQKDQSQNGNLDKVEKAILASISAIWIHVSMRNIRMAVYKANNILRWAASILSLNEFMHNRNEAKDIISQHLSARTVIKFSHVLNVLDLLQERKMQQFSAGNHVTKQTTNKSLRLQQQQEAVIMLANLKLGARKRDVPSTNLGGIINKLQVLKNAMSGIPDASRGKLQDTLKEVIDKSNPSDLNLFGCFQFYHDVDEALQYFHTALEKIEEDDNQLLFELISNMAVCYSNLEQHKKAKEILWWLSTHYLSPNKSMKRNSVKLGPLAFSKLELLWRALISATLSHDPRTTLTIVDSLHSQEQNKSTAVAYLFALVQNERLLLARDHVMKIFPNGTNIPIWALDKTFDRMLDTKVNQTSGLLAVAENNNRGLLCMEQGSIQKALILFEKSLSLNDPKKLATNNSYLHPHYNLTLLCWQNGKESRALEIWLSVRFPLLSQDNLSQVQESLDQAFKNYAKSRKLKQSDVWMADGIGGMEPRCILVLDCLLLQYRVQELENEAFDLAVSAMKKRSKEFESSPLQK